MRLFITLLFLGCAASCVSPAIEKTLDPSDPRLQGIWISESYGEILILQNEQFEYFEWAPTACVQGLVEDETIADYASIAEFEGRDRVSFSSVEEPYPYTFERISNLPESCATPNQNTPLSNFDVFATMFEAYYPFFDLYGVDWPARVTAERATLSETATDQELFLSLRKLIAGLKDAHIEIVAEIDGEREMFDANAGKTETALFRSAVSAGQNPMRQRAEYRRKFWLNDIQDQLHAGEGVIAGDGAIQYGIVSGDIGMISLRTMGGFLESEDQTEIGVLNTVLEDAMQLFEERQVKAVIVNLAMNYGGYDYISRALAERFAAKPTFAYSKVSANDPDANPFEYTLSPSQGTRFTGPVYLLTSDVTVSAGEIATMSMRALPNVTHVGETTRGAFSDVLARQLPNGWEFTLSSEYYYDSDGEIWEGRGLPPEVEIPIFDQANPLDGFLDAMSVLIELIDRQT